jgi:Pyruvate/2-oxoacid:ferredoxin oxidoreductase gamma subunit
LRRHRSIHVDIMPVPARRVTSAGRRYGPTVPERVSQNTIVLGAFLESLAAPEFDYAIRVAAAG